VHSTCSHCRTPATPSPLSSGCITAYSTSAWLITATAAARLRVSLAPHRAERRGQEGDAGQRLQQLGGALIGQVLAAREGHRQDRHPQPVLHRRLSPAGPLPRWPRPQAHTPCTVRYSVTSRRITRSTTWHRSGCSSTGSAESSCPHTRELQPKSHDDAAGPETQTRLIYPDVGARSCPQITMTQETT
jgi:hypothetical protein